MKLLKNQRTIRSRKDMSVLSTAAVIEPLEFRVLLSVSLVLNGTQSIVGGTNYNVSMDSDRHQSEMQIAINPANPLNLIPILRRIGLVALTLTAKIHNVVSVLRKSCLGGIAS